MIGFRIYIGFRFILCQIALTMPSKMALKLPDSNTHHLRWDNSAKRVLNPEP